METPVAKLSGTGHACKKNPYRNKVIVPAHLTRPQIVNLMNGKGFILKPHQLEKPEETDGFIVLEKRKHNKLMRSVKAGKGMRIKLTPEELDMSGGVLQIEGGRFNKKGGKLTTKKMKNFFKSKIGDPVKKFFTKTLVKWQSDPKYQAYIKKGAVWFTKALIAGVTMAAEAYGFDPASTKALAEIVEPWAVYGAEKLTDKTFEAINKKIMKDEAKKAKKREAEEEQKKKDEENKKAKNSVTENIKNREGYTGPTATSTTGTYVRKDGTTAKGEAEAKEAQAHTRKDGGKIKRVRKPKPKAVSKKKMVVAEQAGFIDY